jgi:hypothetical protein
MKKDVDTTHDSQPDLAFDGDQQLNEQLNKVSCCVLIEIVLVGCV